MCMCIYAPKHQHSNTARDIFRRGGTPRNKVFGTFRLIYPYLPHRPKWLARPGAKMLCFKTFRVAFGCADALF